jgi:hypothetical protein
MWMNVETVMEAAIKYALMKNLVSRVAACKALSWTMMG